MHTAFRQLNLQVRIPLPQMEVAYCVCEQFVLNPWVNTEGTSCFVSFLCIWVINSGPPRYQTFSPMSGC